MKIKKVHLAGVIGLLLIAGLVLSPVVNVAAEKPFGENQPPKILHYNPMPDMLKYNQMPMWIIKHNSSH